MVLRSRAFAFLLAGLALSTSRLLPCAAQSKLLEYDCSYDALHLESDKLVTTWEDGAVRVFIVPAGGVIRQGEVRLAAPRMVVWFDRERSARADVRAAQVRVYAEGTVLPDGRKVPVRLAEGHSVRECGAISIQFTSTLSFIWDCPLNKRDEPVPSPLLTRAEQMTTEANGEFIWEDIPPLGPRERLEAVTRSLNADYSETFPEDGSLVFVYVGDVNGSYGNLELRADAAVAWYDTKRHVAEFYAEGNVRVSRAAVQTEYEPIEAAASPVINDVLDYMHADELYINPTDSRAVATSPEMRLKDPRAPVENVYVVRGNKAYVVDSQTLVVTEASITQCDFARPHYRLQTRRAQVVRQADRTVLSAWDVRLKAGKADRTFFWVPFFATNLSSRAFLLASYAIGTSTKLGAFIQTTWMPTDLMTEPPKWIRNWTVNLDYYGARGPAIGTQFDYEFSSGRYPQHEGNINAYFVNDNGSTDDNGAPVPTGLRGRFHLQHRSQLSPEWRVDAEYYWLSDTNFRHEYFQNDFETEKPPESYLLARYLKNSTYLALLYKQQVNNFLTQLEEKPSADLEIMGFPLGRLVYDGSVVAGLYNQEFSNQITPPPLDPPTVARLHVDQRLSLPFMAGIVRVNPFVRAVATSASKGAAVGPTFQSGVSRTGVGAGVTASASFARSYDLSSERFNLNRLRHIVIPYVGVETLSVSGDGSANFIQMDDIDAIDNMTQVTLGVRQRLQTKRQKGEQWRSVDWAELDVALVGRSSDSVNPALDESYLTADFDMLLTDHVSVHSRDNRISLGKPPSVINVGVAADYLPRWALNVDYDLISNVSSTLTVIFNRYLSDRYRLLLFEQYQFSSGGSGGAASLGTTLVLRRVLHKWVLDVGLRVEKATGQVGLIFGFGPTGWGVYADPRRAGRR
jgi:lipopolysaccharide export system protein LptA